MGFFDLSLYRANQFYSWGWRASVFGAVITAVGVGLLMLGTRVRDRDFEDQVATLHGRAADAEEISKKLDQANLLLGTELERERLARVRIEAQIEPRTLSAWQQRSIAEAMRPLVLALKSLDPTRPAITFWTYASDAEARRLVVQLRNLAEGAGLYLYPTTTNITPGELITGVQIGSAKGMEGLRDKLVSLLLEANIDAASNLKADERDTRLTPWMSTMANEGVLVVWVGVKPIPRDSR